MPKSRRVKYDPAQVVRTVIEHPLLFRICEVVFGSDRPLHSSEVGRLTGLSQGYAYTLLSRLEKWGVVEVVKDPANGKTMFRPSSKRVARLLSEEIRRRKAGELVVAISGEEEGQDSG
ncbi:MAG: hypothetical protein QXX39_03405 [Acidilobaceae archaeon]